jgi:hypothetical protein
MKKGIVVVVMAIFCFSMTQCTKDKQTTATPTPVVAEPETDSALFVKIEAGSGFHYYKDNDTIYPSAPESAHKASFRVRFNDILELLMLHLRYA